MAFEGPGSGGEDGEDEEDEEEALPRRDVLIVDGATRSADGTPSKSCWCAPYFTGRYVDGEEGEVARLKWSLALLASELSLRYTRLDFGNGQSDALVDAVCASIESGVYSSVILLAGAHEAVMECLGAALQAFVRGGGALAVVETFPVGRTGGLLGVVRAHFGARWEYSRVHGSYDNSVPLGTAEAHLDPHSDALRRWFGAACRAHGDALDIQGLEAELRYLERVPREQQAYTTLLNAEGEQGTSVAVAAHGAGHVLFTCPTERVPVYDPWERSLAWDMVVRFARHAGAQPRPEEAWAAAAHAGFPQPARARATSLMLLGAAIAAEHAASGSPAGALLDVWRDEVIPRCVRRDWLCPMTTGIIHGLVRAPEWNGRWARVLSHARERICVEVLTLEFKEPTRRTTRGGRAIRYGPCTVPKVYVGIERALLLRPDNLSVQELPSKYKPVFKQRGPSGPKMARHAGFPNRPARAPRFPATDPGCPRQGDGVMVSGTQQRA